MKHLFSYLLQHPPLAVSRNKIPILLLFTVLLTICAERSYAIATRYRISAVSIPTGATNFCEGAATSGYSCTPTGASCAVFGSGNTNTVTWQWLLDGSVIPGASGTFVVNSTGSLAPVLLTAAQANTFSPGSHTLSCRFTSSVTNCSATNPLTSGTLNITVNAAPAGVTVTGGGTVCGSTTLNASGGSPGTIYYQGTTSNGTSTATASSSQSISTAGTYYFRSRSSSGCWGTQGSASVSINPLPNLSNFSTAATSPCQGNGSTVTVTSSSIGNGTYTITYNLSGANSASGATASLTMTGGAGTFTIPSGSLSNAGATTLAITNVRNASLCNTVPGSGNTVNFNVNALPTAITVAGAGTFCEATVLSASGGTGGTIYFQNTTSNGTSTTTASDLELILASGTYYFRAQSPAGCWGPQGSAAVVINPAPAAVSVTGGGTFCNSTTLNASGGGGGTVYFQGTTSNGTSTATPATTQVITTSGTYYFRARTAAGCWGNQGSATVTINNSPDVSDFATAATSLCAGNNSDITVTSSSLATGTYTVTYDVSGANSATGNTATLTMAGGTGTFSIPAAILTANGSNTVTITNIQNASSCNSTPSSGNTAAFNVSAVPTIASISASSYELCIGTGITFTASGVTGPGAPSSFSWMGPDSYANVTTADNATFTPASTAASGNYSVSVTYPGTGCTSAPVATPAVTVNALPTVASISSSEALLCVGANFTLTANSVTGTGTPSYAWSGPAGFSDVTASDNTTVTPASSAYSGAYSLVVTFPGTGCSATQVVSPVITVNELPSVADITASSTTLCVGSDLTLTAGVATGTGTPTYVWSGPNGFSANTSADNTTLTLSSIAAAGAYSLLVTYPGTGCNSTSVATGTINVNEVPTVASITPSSTTLCEGASLVLTAGAATGTGTPTFNWSGPNSYSTTTSVDNTALTVATIASGNYSLSVTYPGTGCSSSTVSTTAITVNTLPTIGSLSASTTNLCVGTDITLTANAVTGTGSPIFNWTGPDAYAEASLANNVTLNAATTLATGSYSVIVTYPGTGCVSAAAVSATIDVNPLPTVADLTPSAIALCEGNVLTLNAGATSGTGTLSAYNWSGPNSYGETTATGTTTLTATSPAATGDYSLTVTYPGTGCTSAAVSAHVIVNPLPVATTGTPEVCVNSTTDLDNTDAGGTWSSTNEPFATVDADGIVSGISAGNADIVYTLPTGCSKAYSITVNALPAAITGDMDVCDGLTTTLNSATTGGGWNSEDPYILQPSGEIVVTGTGAGTARITYTLSTGCQTTAILTVFPLPTPITGMAPVCEQETITLSTTTTGGTWTSSDAAIAAVIASSGSLTGIDEGNATITYTSADGCITTIGATVNITPVAITGNTAVCKGLTTDLDNTTLSGTWSSSNMAVGTIDAGTGELTGLTDGTTEITYTLATGCKTMRTQTVHPLPAAIGGADKVCEGLTTTLSNSSTGGTWHSSNESIASVGSASGIVHGDAAGNITITYTLPTTCSITMPFAVNALPAPITGTFSACQGASSTIDDPGTGGTWASSHPAFATVDASGTVSALSAGNTTITYTLPTGCIAIHSYTVNPLPTAYTGATQICEGVSGTLSNTLPGGTWISSNDAVATVSLSGGITGAASGTAAVTYTLATGCTRIETVTVNPAVPAITGAGEVCQSLSLNLSNTSGGGTWTSNNATIAVAGSSDGVVTGMNAGTTTITYTLPTACYNVANVTVNALPAAITGATQVCAGLSTTLSSATGGGTWISGAVALGTVNTSGVVTGIAAGPIPITYKFITTGCERHTTVTVKALPDAQTVTGGGSYCAGGTGVHIGLANSVPGITYKLRLGATNILSMTGTNMPLDFGAYTTAGTYTILATNNVTSCTNSMTGAATVTITPLVTPIVAISSSHSDTVCAGTVTTYTAVPTNGGTTPTYEWMVNSTVVAASSSYSYTPANGDIVKVKLTSSEACPSPASVNASRTMIVINNEMPTINIAKTSSDTSCQFDFATFSATATWGGDDPVFTWMRNGTAIGSGPTMTYVPTDADVVTCKLNSNFRCRLSNTVTSAGITMNVDSVYVPSVTINAEPGIVVAPSKTVTLTATIADAGPAPFIMWYINGLEQPGEYSPILKRTFDNGDEVKCVVYGSGACGLRSFNTIVMTVDPSVSVGTFTNTFGNIRLAPNPNNGQFVLSSDVNGAAKDKVDIIIMNTLGQSVYTGEAAVRNNRLEHAVQLDDSFANGMYMLHILSGGERKAIPFVLRK